MGRGIWEEFVSPRPDNIPSGRHQSIAAYNPAYPNSNIIEVMTVASFGIFPYYCCVPKQALNCFVLTKIPSTRIGTIGGR